MRQDPECLPGVLASIVESFFSNSKVEVQVGLITTTNAKIECVSTVNMLIYKWNCEMQVREHPLFIEAVTRCIAMHKYACESACNSESDHDFLTPPT